VTETLPQAEPLPTERSHPFDPPARLGVLRERRGLTRLAYPDGHTGWLATSHSAARAVLSDPRFSARGDRKRSPVAGGLGDLGAELVRPGMFIHMDPPDQTKYRRLLTGQFTVHRMRRLEPRIEEITAEHLDAMERHGPPADLVPMFALSIPSLIICELLGVPYEDRERFQADSAILLREGMSTEQIMTAYGSIYAYLSALVAAKHDHPSDDLLSGLVTGGELNEEELINIGLLLLVAGHETTANMLALGTFCLLDNPDQLAALRADPSITPAAVEELLRYLSIAHVGPVRAALEDVEIEGQTIKSGEVVTVSLPAANRDPRHFDDPDRLDLTRQAPGHLAFGHGIHQCLGQQLARIEMRIAYTALFQRFPTLSLAIPAEEVPLRTDMGVYGVHRLPVTWERTP
jgi:cytochrome P450